VRPRVATDSLWNRHHRGLRPNSVENWSSAERSGFSRTIHQTAMSCAPRTRPPRPRHVSRQSSITLATLPAPQHPHTSVCPSYQPPWLVTWRLWSLSQVSSLVLRRSRSISTNSHDLHLHHQPQSLCSTPAHHKLTDMVEQTHNSCLGQSTTRPETLPVGNHSSSTRDATLCSQSPLMSALSTPPHEHI
jgi:hypothetical protein